MIILERGIHEEIMKDILSDMRVLMKKYKDKNGHGYRFEAFTCKSRLLDHELKVSWGGFILKEDI